MKLRFWLRKPYLQLKNNNSNWHPCSGSRGPL